MGRRPTPARRRRGKPRGGKPGARPASLARPPPNPARSRPRRALAARRSLRASFPRSPTPAPRTSSSRWGRAPRLEPDAATAAGGRPRGAAHRSLGQARARTPRSSLRLAAGLTLEKPYPILSHHIPAYPSLSLPIPCYPIQSHPILSRSCRASSTPASRRAPSTAASTPTTRTSPCWFPAPGSSRRRARRAGGPFPGGAAAAAAVGGRRNLHRRATRRPVGCSQGSRHASVEQKHRRQVHTPSRSPARPGPRPPLPLSPPRPPCQTRAQTISTPVFTRQVAPTIAKLLGLDPSALQAVKKQGTAVLPGIF